jgi:hypothetical protein
VSETESNPWRKAWAELKNSYVRLARAVQAAEAKDDGGQAAFRAVYSGAGLAVSAMDDMTETLERLGATGDDPTAERYRAKAPAAPRAGITPPFAHHRAASAGGRGSSTSVCLSSGATHRNNGSDARQPDLLDGVGRDAVRFAELEDEIAARPERYSAKPSAAEGIALARDTERFLKMLDGLEGKAPERADRYGGRTHVGQPGGVFDTRRDKGRRLDEAVPVLGVAGINRLLGMEPDEADPLLGG